ncbi:MAG: hypothetical protein JWM90_3102 [Thermoleophilia bacterium]|nr:hypothetical protein [Thermoleophilia bacterium]
MSKLISRRRIAAFGVVLALASTGIAVAYWTGGGSGSGSATVGTSGNVTLTGTIGAGLAPGTDVPVALTAANATTSDIFVGTVRLVSISVDGAHATCDTDDFSMADVAQGHQVPAGATAEALPVDGSLVFAESGVSQDACKGATLTLTLSSN